MKTTDPNPLALHHLALCAHHHNVRAILTTGSRTTLKLLAQGWQRPTGQTYGTVRIGRQVWTVLVRPLR